MTRRATTASSTEELFSEHSPAILAYFVRRVPSPEDAADLMSEVMLIAWRRRHEMPPPPEDLLWLYGVARNLLANHRRSTRRRTAGTEALAAELRLRPECGPAEDRDEILDVRAAIQALPRMEREILTLSVWEGLSSREIAAIVGLPASTVRERLARTRETVRRAVLGSPRCRD